MKLKREILNHDAGFFFHSINISLPDRGVTETFGTSVCTSVKSFLKSCVTSSTETANGGPPSLSSIGKKSPMSKPPGFNTDFTITTYSERRERSMAQKQVYSRT